MNLRIAATGFGYCPQVETLPDSKEPDLLARVTVTRVSGACGVRDRQRQRTRLVAGRTGPSAHPACGLPAWTAGVVSQSADPGCRAAPQAAEPRGRWISSDSAALGLPRRQDPAHPAACARRCD
ncbi:protein of unknown function [Candidatus Nitrospira inopinata]|uniref:Uncharacterized protein n=1 Tax=Candidatus Nitrospira inopinata TaxID=1715989 RepID=A0A0S4KXF0_9BACT|nr:protein of unknown function [Candidatus Nitrospira inopinata]